jgi:hypothetical protein
MHSFKFPIVLIDSLEKKCHDQSAQIHKSHRENAHMLQRSILSRSKAFALTLMLFPAALFAQTTQPSPTNEASDQRVKNPLEEVLRLEHLLKRNDIEKDAKGRADDQTELAGWLLCSSPDTIPQSITRSITASRKALALLNPKTDPERCFKAQVVLSIALLLSSDLHPANHDRNLLAGILAMDLNLAPINSNAKLQLWVIDDYALHPQFANNIRKAISNVDTAFTIAQANPPAASRSQSLACVAYLWSILPAKTQPEKMHCLEKSLAYWSAAIALLPLNSPPDVNAKYQTLYANTWRAIPAQNDLEKYKSLAVSADLSQKILDNPGFKNQPLAIFEATICLSRSLIDTPLPAPQERLLLAQRGAAACESALRLLPADFNPESRAQLHGALESTLYVMSQIPGQDKVLLLQRAIAHRKAAIILTAKSQPELSQILTVHMRFLKDEYEKVASDSNTPFDSINAAQ